MSHGRPVGRNADRGWGGVVHGGALLEISDLIDEVAVYLNRL